MSSPERFDVGVIGAGLAGLIAATKLAAGGRRVILAEAQPRVGGLCKVITLDGFPFVVGCNDFGSGLETLLDALGASPGFRPTKTRFLIGERQIQLPPNAATLAAILPRMGQLLRAVRRIKAAGDDDSMLTAVGPISERIGDLLRILCYGVGAPDMLVHQLRAAFSKELGYGYDKGIVPVGGPDAITQSLARRFEELGGELVLGTRADHEAPDDSGHYRLLLAERRVRARALISSQPRAPLDAPASMRSGLSAAAVHLAVDAAHPWEAGLHTLGFMPSPIASWFDALDRGEEPAQFGFHLFNSGLERTRSCYSLTGFFYLPRGLEAPTSAQQQAHLEQLRAGVERLSPGMWAAARLRRVVYPAEYERLVGALPRPSPYVYEPGVRKPPSLDPATGIHHVGNSVEPPGEHAGGAALSGWRAAVAVEASL